jgi:CheY-like chemotaxis protein
MATVLLIDDDNDVREMVAQLLKRGGHTVLAANNGAEGLRQFAAQRADIIITDIFMPEMEGLETIAALRQQAEGIPIIAMSGGWQGSNLDFLGVAKAMGAARCFRKPIDRAELLAAIDELTEPPAAPQATE